MNTNTIKRFYSDNILITIFMVVIIWAVGYFSEIRIDQFTVILPTYCLIINLVMFNFTKNLIDKNRSFQIVLSILFAGKFFGYILPVIFTFILKYNKEAMYPFIVSLFALYLIFSVLLIHSVLKYYKRTDLSDDNSK